MGDSALRRPALRLLAAYIGLLAWLHGRGAFVPPVPDSDWTLAGTRARVEMLVDRPAREDRLGWKGEAQGESLPYRLEVRWPRGSRLEDLPLPGDRAAVEGRLRRPRAPKNPGDFDEAAFLADRGVAWVLEADSAAALPGRAPWRLRPARLGERLRRSVHARLAAALPPERARLAEGLSLGCKGALTPPLSRALRDSGLIHLVVPSGAKVAVALALALALAAALRLGPWARWLLLAAFGGAVTLAAGAEPPYVRALLAALALAAARAAGREGDAFQALLAAAWLELLWAPRDLFSAGFQMSYLALAGILAALPAVERACRRLRPRRVRALALALGVSAAVQLSLWPVFAADFQRGSAVGLVSNALAVPCYPALAAGSWAVWAASFAGPRAAAAAAAPVSGALALFEGFVTRAAAAPGAVVALSPWKWTGCAAFYAALLGVTRRRRAAAAALLALAGGFWLAGRLEAPCPLRVVFLKVPPLARRRRSAALVAAGSETWLVGSAPPALVRKVVVALGLPPPRPAAGLTSIRLGRVVVGVSPPGVCVAGRQSAIIARFKSSSIEVQTDGVEVHEGFPR